MVKNLQHLEHIVALRKELLVLDRQRVALTKKLRPLERPTTRKSSIVHLIVTLLEGSQSPMQTGTIIDWFRQHRPQQKHRGIFSAIYRAARQHQIIRTQEGWVFLDCPAGQDGRNDGVGSRA